MKEKAVEAVKKIFSKKALITLVVVILVKELLFSKLPYYLAAIIIILFGGAYVIDKVRRTFWAVAKRSKYVASAQKTFSRAISIYSMPDEQFDAIVKGRKADTSVHQDAAIHEAEVSHNPCNVQTDTKTTPRPIIPSAACKQTISNEQAAVLARSWWDETHGDGMTGAELMDHLIQSITMDAPHIHTCDITEHDEILKLPKVPIVRTALGQIMRENGLAADINEDGTFIVCWLQTSDGKEAGDQ